MTIEAAVSLRGEGVSGIGRERIRLLEAVARAGSISGGARAVGLSYKAAWDALEAMSNLFGQPLLTRSSGGASGGGATLTPAGLRLIEAFARLESEMVRVVRALEPDLAGTGITPLNLMSGFLMRTSARNALRGIIRAIEADKVNADVAVEVSPGTFIHASVTAQSVRDLGLCVGREAVVLIKAPFVMIAPDDAPCRTSARNAIAGTVLRCERSAINAEVVVDIGGGKTLASVITAHSAEALGIAPGVRVLALFDASHVLIAID